MKTLAQAIVWLMEEFVRTDEGGIDGQACGDIMNYLWFDPAEASPEERQALASAASDRLAGWLHVDENGFSHFHQEETFRLLGMSLVGHAICMAAVGMRKPFGHPKSFISA